MFFQAIATASSIAAVEQQEMHFLEDLAEVDFGFVWHFLGELGERIGSFRRGVEAFICKILDLSL